MRPTLTNEPLRDSVRRFLMEPGDGHILSGRQCRMARAALNWSAVELAKHAEVSRATITRVECEQITSNWTSLAAIRRAFEAAGLEFVGDNCVADCRKERGIPIPPPMEKRPARRTSRSQS
jgi:DNA-binding XRE family transcriptional regulator